MEKAIEIALNRRGKLPTRKLMKCLSTATLMKPPPEKRGKRMKVKFITQANMGVCHIIYKFFIYIILVSDSCILCK